MPMVRAGAPVGAEATGVTWGAGGTGESVRAEDFGDGRGMRGSVPKRREHGKGGGIAKNRRSRRGLTGRQNPVAEFPGKQDPVAEFMGVESWDLGVKTRLSLCFC
ncbi:putative cyclophilin type peptidyl-prolyl cis-trans isomerase [Methylorubrum populi]|uniref:Putative cyclophilin type peptidyl-prolyl cis-trans isomerase n=1 Tax=Methylorubrum populi TaxID=223967 RepID=A0A169QXQ7_9HYPH|nr:putative cyclophilin type peptidyl-prolyl cis-trans isomerase [Methylorubrum populi]